MKYHKTDVQRVANLGLVQQISKVFNHDITAAEPTLLLPNGEGSYPCLMKNSHIKSFTKIVCVTVSRSTESNNILSKSVKVQVFVMIYSVAYQKAV